MELETQTQRERWASCSSWGLSSSTPLSLQRSGHWFKWIFFLFYFINMCCAVTVIPVGIRPFIEMLPITTCSFSFLAKCALTWFNLPQQLLWSCFLSAPWLTAVLFPSDHPNKLHLSLLVLPEITSFWGGKTACLSCPKYFCTQHF